MRDEIALALDGAIPDDDRASFAAYRAALDPVTVAMGPHIQCLRQFGAAGLVAASTRFDDTHRLLRALDVGAISTAAIPENGKPPGILVLGCRAGNSPARTAWVVRMLQRGAVIVSSDRFAGDSTVASTLNVAASRPPARARVALNPRVADTLLSHGEWGRLVAEMNPAVRLAPGHLPLAMAQHAETRIIASNAMTGEPLIVSARIGNGLLIHSVAHWWQDVNPDATAIGRRPLASAPAFTTLGLKHPEARLGGFAAASVQLAGLFAALEPAFIQLRQPSPMAESR
jgi:hypothetical protein